MTCPSLDETVLKMKKVQVNKSPAYQIQVIKSEGEEATNVKNLLTKDDSSQNQKTNGSKIIEDLMSFNKNTGLKIVKVVPVEKANKCCNCSKNETNALANTDQKKIQKVINPIVLDPSELKSVTNIPCPVPNCDKILRTKANVRIHVKMCHKGFEMSDGKKEKVTEEDNCVYHCPVESCKYSINNGKYFKKKKFIKQVGNAIQLPVVVGYTGV